MFLIFGTAFTLLAFLSTNSILQPVSCFCSAIFITLLAARSNKLLREFYIYGFLIHLIAFYWLPETLKVFGGFDTSLAWGIHSLFAITAALQWLIIGLLVKAGKSKIGFLAFPLAYALTDLVMPQMFPWSFANPLITFHPLSAFAEVFGSKGVSFILLLLTSLGVEAVLSLSRLKKIVVAQAVFVTLLLGAYLDYQAKEELKNSIPIKLGLVQGNIGFEEKSNSTRFDQNLSVFRALSQEALTKGAELVIWPETTNEDWTPNLIPNIRGTAFDPTNGMEMNLLYGLLSYDGRSQVDLKRYNAAFLLDSKGIVQGRYAKQILMPFGEYLPFESLFPWLREFSPMTGNFESGVSSTPLELQLSDKIVRPSVLICYEDLVPSLARDSVNQGGNILVNITNDSWYGDTAALAQHSLLASWRSIETRRTLVRATNTGLTTIISARGDTVSQLKNFKRDLMVETAFLSNTKTLYTSHGDLPFTGLLILCGILGLYSKKVF